MTYEQIFAGRMILMRAQRHIAQASRYYGKNIAGSRNGAVFAFRSHSRQQAFFIVESLLVELEGEFDEKRKHCQTAKSKRLAARADRQVIQERTR